MGSGKGKSKRVSAIKAQRVNDLLPKSEVVHKPVSAKYLANRIHDTLGDGKINIVTLIDRSGSVFSIDKISDDQQKIIERLNSLERDDKKIRTSIWGYSGGWNETEVYEYKDFNDEAHPEFVKNTGGGGTPTGEAIEHAHNLMKDKKGKNVILVITDGAAYNIKELKTNVNECRKQGISVAAIFQKSDNYFDDDVTSMDNSFGKNNWQFLDNEDDLDDFIIEDAIKSGFNATQQVLGKEVPKAKRSSHKADKNKPKTKPEKKITKIETVTTKTEYIDEDGNPVNPTSPEINKVEYVYKKP